MTTTSEISITFTPQEWVVIRDYLKRDRTEVIEIVYKTEAELREKFKPFGDRLAQIEELADRIDALLQPKLAALEELADRLDTHLINEVDL